MKTLQQNTKNTYSIKELIETLTTMLNEREDLTPDSKILICDKDMGEFKDRFKIHYVNRYGEGCIGLFFEEPTEEPKKHFFSTVIKNKFDML